ncbi:MAG: AMP-binding protein [Bacteroidales bacterium]|nr:AMP-binding protein [Bacteroidales bacterium]
MEVSITRTFDLLEHLIVNYPKDDIFAAKRNGKWECYSAHDYYKYAHYLCYGLCGLGLQPGDRVLTMSSNCPEWNFMDMALAMGGFIHVPIYPTLSVENYTHILRHSEAKLLLVESKVLLKRIRPALDALGDDAPQVYTLANIPEEHQMMEILRLGIAGRDTYLPLVEQRKRDIKETDWVTLIYTSGTTGDPKGVMLSHRNICSNFLAHANVNAMDSSCRALSFLPLNHMYERSMNYHFQYLGVSIYYAESMGTIAANLAEIHANGFTAVPRVLEMMYDKLYAAGKDLKGFKKWMYFKAIRHGEHYDQTIIKKLSPYFLLKQRIYDRLVYRHWRERFGGNRMTIITGSSVLPQHVLRLFSAAGLDIYEGYGLSETSPVIAVNNQKLGIRRFGTVGPILEGVEVKFADDGEILARGPNVMMGYYKDEAYTREVIDEDGWFHTGDVGTMVAGKFLKITDRKKDIFKLSAGKYVAPQLIENKLRESVYIDQVMVVGANEKFASAIISPNFNTLHYWALKHMMHYRDNVELIGMPEVQAKYKSLIDEMNKMFAPHEQIKAFRLVAEEWTSGNGLLSPTLKLKRNLLSDKYKGVISGIYNKDEAPAGLFSAFRQVELPSIRDLIKRQ